MKASAVVLLIYVLAVNGAAQQPNGVPEVTHVATAVNHLTVLEFHEAVTMAAAGSADFQIERQQNKVFIKPMKSGIATDLFVWTQSRRYAYELETTEEVKNMSFAIDNMPATPPPITSATDDMADLMLTRAFLEAEKIQSSRPRLAKDRVSVRVEQVFRTRTSLYLYFTVENKTKHLWHVPELSATSLEAHEANPELPSLVRQQLDEKTLKQFGDVGEFPLPIAHAEYATQDVQPDGTTQGVVVIRKQLNSPCIVRLTFDAQVKATVVL
jgi:hypothetical protein